MQVDLNLIPQFDSTISDGITGAFATGSGGLGIPEFLFFLATYIWETTGGENASTALDVFF
jgi:hypothetical protein